MASSAVSKVAIFFGFSKNYNLTFYVVFAGALLGFTLARFQYLNYDGIFCGGRRNGAAPGECYYYKRDHYRVGMLIHLACILPASILAILQFTPAIRRRWILFHRLNGHLIACLVSVSIIGALMIARRAFGGGIETQAGVGFLSIMTLISLGFAIVSIKRLCIDQHRAWMLRCWFYLGSIITDRIIMILATVIISKLDYHTVRPCAQLASTSQSDAQSYPECAGFFDGSDPQALAIVHANLQGTANEIGAALGMPFGMAIWLGLAIHAIGVEIYLNLTPKEAERLRKVSTERRAEAGLATDGHVSKAVEVA